MSGNDATVKDIRQTLLIPAADLTSLAMPSHIPIPSRTPSVAHITAFLTSHFPIRAKEVPFEYHIPRVRSFNAALAPVKRVVVSITPTEGVYAALNNFKGRNPVAFIHRPFGVDRRRLRRDATVLSSHKGFDEVLTVGFNVALAQRLQSPLGESIRLQGYKGDAERRIGIVFRVQQDAKRLLDAIKSEFGSVDDTFGFESEEGRPNSSVKIVAIMNAFHPEEVDWVLESAHSQGWIDSASDGSSVLYLTGAVREPGLVHAQERGMSVVCVGHRSCEAWGIRYLASRLRTEYPALEVIEVDEEEAPIVKGPPPGPVTYDGTGPDPRPNQASSSS